MAWPTASELWVAWSGMSPFHGQGNRGQGQGQGPSTLSQKRLSQW